MPLHDLWILMGMGGLFIILGLVAFVRGRSEENSYYDSLSARADLREFLERQPRRSQPAALRVGGWIAIAIGLAMLVVGGVFLLWA